MITGYYTKEELQAYTGVFDKDVNELFQEIRSIEPNFYLKERKTAKRTGVFVKKVVLYYHYTLLKDTGFGECQIINFCQDFGTSINTMVSKSFIITFFLGYLNGYNKNKPQ